MQGNFESTRVDRRALLVGGAALASGGLFVATPQAKASPGQAAWTAGLVAAPPSKDFIQVREMPAETGRTWRVELRPDTVVRSHVSPGNTLLVRGVTSDDVSTISAQTVIRATFGSRSDIER